MTARWERARGWPTQAAGILVVFSFLVLALKLSQERDHLPGWLALSDLILWMAAFLAWTRRCLEIEVTTAGALLHHGWGLETPWEIYRLRGASTPISNLQAIWVEQTDHYKGSPVYAIVGGSRSSAQLLDRAILDDEYPDLQSARTRATWLASELQVAFFDPLA